MGHYRPLSYFSARLLLKVMSQSAAIRKDKATTGRAQQSPTTSRTGGHRFWRVPTSLLVVAGDRHPRPVTAPRGIGRMRRGTRDTIAARSEGLLAKQPFQIPSSMQDADNLKWLRAVAVYQ